MERLTPTDLEALPQYLIVVKRRRFRLILFKLVNGGYWRHFDCRCATGALGFATPPGPHLVLSKESPPTYTAPNSKWAQEAGYIPGQQIPPDDPVNPICGAWLGLTNYGIGIHGTRNLLSLGSRASHGCIRVSEEDAVTLYNTVPLGTSVVIL